MKMFFDDLFSSSGNFNHSWHGTICAFNIFG